MIEDGLLRTLERKGVLDPLETRTMLDGAIDELRGIPSLVGNASADAAKTVVGCTYRNRSFKTPTAPLPKTKRNWCRDFALPVPTASVRITCDG